MADDDKPARIELDVELIADLDVPEDEAAHLIGGVSAQITCSRAIVTQSCQAGVCNPAGT